MIRRPPRSTPKPSSAASDVYKRQTRTEGQAHTFEGKKDFETARPLELSEIPRLLDDYELATRNALAAGFDGVQIHAANGYLIDEFLRDNANHREDEYGGSPENRIRLLREITERVISVAGKERVGVRLSPNGDSQGVDDSDPASVFVPAARMLSDLGIAFLEPVSYTHLTLPTKA